MKDYSGVLFVELLNPQEFIDLWKAAYHRELVARRHLQALVDWQWESYVLN